MSFTPEQYEKDIRFLANRQEKAGQFGWHGTRRDVGQSANSIVSIAYGLTSLDKQKLPGDWDDLWACEAMWDKLPKHRKTGDALKAMERARGIFESNSSIG